MNRSLVRIGLVVLTVGVLAAAPAPDDKGSDKPKSDAEALKGLTFWHLDRIREFAKEKDLEREI